MNGWFSAKRELLGAGGRRPSGHRATLYATSHGVEGGGQVATNETDSDDDNNGNERDHDAVFDGGGTLFVAANTSGSV